MIRFVKAGGIEQKDIAQTVVVNYEKHNEFIHSDKAVFVKADAIRSPMGSNIAAVTTDAANKVVREGRILSWNEVYQLIE